MSPFSARVKNASFLRSTAHFALSTTLIASMAFATGLQANSAPAVGPTSSSPLPLIDTMLSRDALQPGKAEQEAEKERLNEIRANLRETLGTIRFIRNDGQWHESVLFMGKSLTGNVVVERNQLRFITPQKAETEDGLVEGQHFWSLKFEGSTGATAVSAPGFINSYQNYMIGSVHQSNIPVAHEIVLEDVYPGVDLRLYGREAGMLEFDWVIAPGADYQQIQLRVDGLDGMEISDPDEMSLRLRHSNVALNIPETYQVDGDQKIELQASFEMPEANLLAYHVNDVNPELPLVIDPTLDWGTWIDGQSSGFDEYLFAITVDGQDRVWAAGATNVNFNLDSNSPNRYITLGNGITSFQPDKSDVDDAMVLLLSEDGSEVIYATHYGGTNDAANSDGLDKAFAIALDDPDNPTTVYIAGITGSADLPMCGSGAPCTDLPFRGAKEGEYDGFVAAFDGTLSNLKYATYVGSSSDGDRFGANTDEVLFTIRAIDDNSFAVAGTFGAGNAAFISANAPDPSFDGDREPWFGKFDDFNTLTFGTYVGGDPTTAGTDDEVQRDMLILNDGRMAFLVSGDGADDTLFPTLVNDFGVKGNVAGDLGDIYYGVFQDTCLSGGACAFDTLVRMGGTGDEEPFGMLQIGNSVYLTGRTESQDLPLDTNAGTPQGQSPFQPTNGGADGTYDAFVADIPIDGALNGGEWNATYLGGTGDDIGNSLSQFFRGVFVYGTTASADGSFPTQNIGAGTFFSAFHGDQFYSGGGDLDIFFSTLDITLEELVFSTYIGGGFNDYLGETGNSRGANHIFANDRGLWLGTTFHSGVQGPATCADTRGAPTAAGAGNLTGSASNQGFSHVLIDCDSFDVFKNSTQTTGNDQWMVFRISSILIGDLVWWDRFAPFGEQGPGEPGIGGIEVCAWNTDDSPVINPATTNQLCVNTDFLGQYSMSEDAGLVQGTDYYITIDLTQQVDTNGDGVLDTALSNIAISPRPNAGNPEASDTDNDAVLDTGFARIDFTMPTNAARSFHPAFDFGFLPAVTAVEKEVTAGPTATGNANEFTISYDITVINDNASQGLYDLEDELQFGAGTSIVSATIAYDGTSTDTLGNPPVNANWNGSSDVDVIEDEPIGGNSFDRYNVDVVFTVDQTLVTDESRDCDPTNDQDGNTGLRNEATVRLSARTSLTADDCEPIPATFTVFKDFSDDNVGNVTVALTCTGAGTIVANNLTASEATPAVFVITGASGTETCTATESNVPAGYTGDITDCQDNDLIGGSCTIVNNLNTGRFMVNKTYSDGTQTPVQVTLTCTSGNITTNPLMASPATPADFEVTGFVPGATCTAVESSVPVGYTADNAQCQDGDPIGGSCTIVNTLTMGMFTVTKSYSDGNTVPVGVTLACSSGNVTNNPRTAAPGAPAVFTVEGFGPGTTCTATEGAAPAGYSTDASDCTDGDPIGGTCNIANTLRTAQFTVTKSYSDANTDPVTVTLTCSSGDVTSNGLSAAPGAPAVFDVTGFEPGATCTAQESNAPAGYTQDNSDCMDNDAIGGSCNITNTLNTGQFTVFKSYTDATTDAVTVNLTCSTGDVTSNGLSAAPGAPAVFDVTGFTPGATCNATESNIPVGYTADALDCQDNDPIGGSCTITNSPLPPALNLRKQADGPAVDNGDGTYTVVYTITASNVGDQIGVGTYDIVDTFTPGVGITLNSATIVPVGHTPDTPNPIVSPFTSGQTVVDDESIGIGATELWSVTAVYDIDPVLVTGDSADCDEANTGGTNTGFANEVSGILNERDTSDNRTCVPLLLGNLVVIKDAQSNTGLNDTFSFTNADAVIGNFDITTVAGTGQVSFNDLVPGNFVIDEAALAGWIFEGASCDTQEDPTVDGATVSGNATTTCTFVNTAVRPALNLSKSAVGPAVDNGDGTYTVDYLITAANVGPEAGDDTYNIIDTFTPGTGITLNIATIAPLGHAPDGPNAVESPFTSGEQVVTGEPIDAGATELWTVTAIYDIDPALVTVDSADCDESNDGGTNTGFANEVSGVDDETDSTDNRTCVPLLLGNLVVIKEATSSGGLDDTFSFLNADAAVGDFDITTVAGTGQVEYMNLVPGNFVITEEPLDGWVLDVASCDTGEDPSVVGATVSASATTTCTFTNRAVVPGLNLTKVAEGPAVDNGDGTYTVNYRISAANIGDDVDDTTYDIIDTFTPGAGITLNNATIVEVGHVPDGPNAVVSPFTSGQTVVDDEPIGIGETEFWLVTAIYDIDPTLVTAASANCDESDAGATNTGFANEVSGVIDETDTTDNRACVELPLGTLVIVKEALSDAGTDGTFSFVNSDTGVGDFDITTVGGTGQATFADLVPGTFVVMEEALDDWLLEDVSCDNGDDPTATGVVVSGGETVTCTFTNRLEEILPGVVAGACLNNAPFLDYEVTPSGLDPEPTTVDIRWYDANDQLEREDLGQPLTGMLLWPGAALNMMGDPVAWPGWDCDAEGANCVMNADFDRLRPNMRVEFTFNPVIDVVVSYPPATPNCNADPGTPPNPFVPRPVPVDAPWVLLMMILAMLGTGWYFRPAPVKTRKR